MFRFAPELIVLSTQCSSFVNSATLFMGIKQKQLERAREIQFSNSDFVRVFIEPNLLQCSRKFINSIASLCSVNGIFLFGSSQLNLFFYLSALCHICSPRQLNIGTDSQIFSANYHLGYVRDWGGQAQILALYLLSLFFAQTFSISSHIFTSISKLYR